MVTMTPETTATTLDELVLAPPRPVRAPKTKQLITTPAPSRRAFIDGVAHIHEGRRSLATGASDALAMFGTAIAAGVPSATAGILVAVVAFGLYVGSWYADRSSLETQGIFWSVRPIALPLGLTTLVSVGVSHAAGWNVGEPLMFGGAALGGLLALRTVTWAIVARARRRGKGLRRTLIVGDSKHARMLSSKLISFPEAGLLPVAMLPAGNGHGYTRFLPPFPSAEQLSNAISEGDIEHVVLAPDGSDEAILECVKGSAGLDVSFSLLPPLSELFLHPGLVAQVGGLPLIPLGAMARRRRTLPGKRILDLTLTAMVLVLVSPLLAVTALAIKLFDGGPVIYRQRRVGRDGLPFYALKFRSMVVGAERLVIDLRDQNVTNGLLFKVVDDPRITKVGHVIRRFAIDELPQLWNVIRGEMSLVGPRPLAVEPEDFTTVDNQRHAILPGITGYWQISGGNDLTYEEMIKLDLAYIENWSLWLDLRLLMRTVPAVINRRGPA
jgi:exopolysaccharide biosynthesis polyprenyl glycosylphosphotransferase